MTDAEFKSITGSHIPALSLFIVIFSRFPPILCKPYTIIIQYHISSSTCSRADGTVPSSCPGHQQVDYEPDQQIFIGRFALGNQKRQGCQRVIVDVGKYTFLPLIN